MKNKVTVKMIRKAIKLLRKYKVPEPYYIEVENPTERTDFLRVIEKEDLLNCEYITDNKGNTKVIMARPTLLL